MPLVISLTSSESQGVVRLLAMVKMLVRVGLSAGVVVSSLCWFDSDVLDDPFPCLICFVASSVALYLSNLVACRCNLTNIARYETDSKIRHNGI